MVAAGLVPAERTGMVLVVRQIASASWERALLAVQTNATRSGVVRGGGLEGVERFGGEADVAASFVFLGRGAGDGADFLEGVNVVCDQVGGHP